MKKAYILFLAVLFLNMSPLSLLAMEGPSAEINELKEIKRLLPKAKRGDPASQYKLSELYGNLVKKTGVAGKVNEPSSLTSTIYLQDKRSLTYMDERNKWFHQAAEQNYIHPINGHSVRLLLAVEYIGKEQYDKAAYWLNKCTPEEQYIFGVMNIASGDLIPRNLEEARKWMEIAAKGGHKDRWGLAKLLSTEDVDNEELITLVGFSFESSGFSQKAEEIFLTLSAEAQYGVGQVFATSSIPGWTKNIEKAKKWYSIAADNGCTDAREELDSM